ncbi:MAG: hypothetical protein Fur005_41200 [Roseiflexaceae bacterium]
MGKQSRAKRERRANITFTARLTDCDGTRFANAPDMVELSHIQKAVEAVRNHRHLAQSLVADRDRFHQLSLQMYREDHWKVLHFSDELIEAILDEIGEPPIVIDNNDPAFSNYLLKALGVIASARVRRAMAEQSRRFLPHYVNANQIPQALAIEHNAYMTVMSDAATPLLVQMLVGGLARWYEENEEDEEAPAETTESA